MYFNCDDIFRIFLCVIFSIFIALIATVGFIFLFKVIYFLFTHTSSEIFGGLK
jgi:hypothetical protein